VCARALNSCLANSRSQSRLYRHELVKLEVEYARLRTGGTSPESFVGLEADRNLYFAAFACQLTASSQH